MANNRIAVLIDVTVDRANQSLKSFRQSIMDAEGATGKFKAGASGAMDSVKANAGAMAIGAGAALVAFGAKAISAFQETAIASGKMRDSLGVTAEEASRLIEVSEDLGIGAETLEKSIGIMNRTATNTPAHFAAIGAELVKNADGTMNVNETFLSTIDALNKIPDASQRAAAAQKVFGRSWMDMAELIGVGADGVRDALASVEGGKIIDDEEVARARRYRDAMDRLRGVVEELTVEMGGKLVPVLTDAANGLSAIADVARDLKLLDIGSMFMEWTTGLSLLGKAAGVVAGETDLYGRTIHNVTDEQMEFVKAADAAGKSGKEIAAQLEAGTTSMAGWKSETELATIALGESTEAAEELGEVGVDAGKSIREAFQETTAAYDSLTERLSDSSALANLKLAFIETFDEAYEKNKETEEGVLRNQVAVNGLTGEILTYLTEVLKIPKETATAMVLSWADKTPQEVEAEIDRATRQRIVSVLFKSAPLPTFAPGVSIGQPKPEGAGATGAIVNRPTVALIGEAGPEALVPLNRTPGNGPLPPGGGDTINITVQGLTGPQVADDVIDKIMEWKRRNGGLPW